MLKFVSRKAILIYFGFLLGLLANSTFAQDYYTGKITIKNNCTSILFSVWEYVHWGGEKWCWGYVTGAYVDSGDSYTFTELQNNCNYYVLGAGSVPQINFEADKAKYPNKCASVTYNIVLPGGSCIADEPESC